MRDVLALLSETAKHGRAPQSAPRATRSEDREYTDAEIREFVEGLESLQGGSLTAAILVSCGPRTIPPLRDFLLNGRPRGVFQPRQRAVEVLAELGARDVLLEYLRLRRPIADPVVRFGEEAVRSTAARLLANWPSDELFAALLGLSSTQLLSGLVEALGVFGRIEAASYFLKALGDDICRAAATQALLRIGAKAGPLLVQAATSPYPTGEEETPSSLRRRRSCLRILLELGVSSDEWRQLRDLLRDKDSDLAAQSAFIAMRVAPPEDQEQSVRRLIEILPTANWFLRTEARDCFVEHFALARPLIEMEVARRSQQSKREQALDIVLRFLFNVLHQGEQKETEGKRDAGNRR